MEHLRNILLGALLFVVFLLWNAWQKDFAVKPEATATPAPAAAPVAANASTETLPAVPAPPTSSPVNTAAPQAIPADRLVHIKTDVLNIVIDKLGGSL